jgi:ABC-2 type transport system ATP-binding protein
VGVVLQEPTLDPRLSVLENLLITAGLYGELGRSARERAATALHWLGAEPLAARPVKTLSGGERRRADVARALMGNPDVLLLDEPTHGLDEASFRALWDRLQGLAKEQGQALLVATHRPDEAERCNTLWLVARGAVVRSTTPAALRAAQPGEVLRVDSTEPQRVVEHASALGAVVHLQGNIAHIEAPRCAELLPRLLERLAPGTVRSVVLRQPTLADAFAQLTGEALVASQMGAE